MIPLKDTIRARSFPLVNWLLIAANVFVFVYEESLGTRQLNQLVVNFGLVPARFASGHPEPYLTLFTSMFLHGGWLHIISNMLALYIFGDNVEDRMGSGRYLVFYLVCGLAGNLLHIFVNAGDRAPAIGASGAIAGVLAAYLVLYPRARVITLILIFFFPWFVEIPSVIYLGIWFLSQLFSGLLELGASAAGGVAYWVHVGGFLCGLLLVFFFARRSKSYQRWYPDEHRPW